MYRKCRYCESDIPESRPRSIYCSRLCGKRADYEKNKKRYRDNTKLWYANNIDRARKSRREYYWSNPEKFRQKTKAYWDARRDEKRQKDRIYKDKIRHGGKRVPMIASHGLKCSMCDKTGTEFDIVTHHLVDKDNHDFQILLCRSCHAKIHMLTRVGVS